jgi:hypothetical protein
LVGLWMGSLRRSSLPSSSEPTELKGQSFWRSKTKRSRTGWVAM